MGDGETRCANRLVAVGQTELHLSLTLRQKSCYVSVVIAVG